MDRGAWLATVHGAAKELDMTEQLTFKTNDRKQTLTIRQRKNNTLFTEEER